MTTTLKLLLREDKARTDGTAPVYLRITHRRRSRFVKSGVRVAPNLWSPAKQRVSRTHPLAAKLNQDLEALMSRAMQARTELNHWGRPTAEAVQRLLKEDGGASTLFPFMESYADEWKRKGKYWEYKKVLVLRNKLRGYAKRKGLDFRDIDREFLIGFRSYMRTECKNMESTQEKALYMLKAIFKRAVQDKLISPTDDPFVYYSIGVTRGTREKLTLQQIHDLEAVEVEPGSKQEVARDVFLFAFYASGMRFGDVCSLRWECVRGDRLVYTMMKSGKPKSVKLKRRAQEILDRYRTTTAHSGPFVFPLLDPDLDYSDPFFLRKKVHSKTAGVNLRLKQLAEKAGIEAKVTTHVARHSFADLARRKSNGNVDAVRRSLGHSKLQTTQTYLDSFDQDAEDGLMDVVFD